MLDRYNNAPVLDEVISNIDEGTTIKALGGLHYIAANPLPHFSLGYVEFDEKGVEIKAGQWGERLQDLLPEFDDLFALVNCDIEGVPMHAQINGWYWLGFTEPQVFDEGRVAEHFRIERLEANFLRQEIIGVLNTPTTLTNEAPMKPAWDFYLSWIEQQRPRWKADAQSAIKAHDLEVYGDPWAAS